MQDHFGHRISYLRVSVTDRCNERCSYCMPDELQEWVARADVLTFPETLRLIRVGAQLGIDKVRVTGGEPLTRKGVTEFLREVTAVNGINRVGVSTNGTLLVRASCDGNTIAQEVRAAGVDSLNISLDTLDRAVYQRVTGRDFLPRVLEGIEAAIEARFPQIKLNAVLMRGQNEDALLALIDFAGERKLLLRFIELMPVSATEVLNESNFFPVAAARRVIETRLGSLIPQPDFKTSGPATYYQIPGRDQRIGFIGALTNLHFCDTCNKLRLTCDGKLRPCLGSHLEFDIMKPLRAGASDDELRSFFLNVVERKPERHEFRENYQPQRRMVAIGG
jgi:cyclic pyranopterin phosphate synthase